MKTRKITTILLAGMLLLFTGKLVNAQTDVEKPNQPGCNKMHQMLDLTEEQQGKIEELKTAQMKEMLQLKNQLNELKAKQQTLKSAENADMKAINANIDEITSVKNKMMKQKAKHHQDVRALLTEDQRVKFDSHRFGKGHGCDYGFMHGQKGHYSKQQKCRQFDGN